MKSKKPRMTHQEVFDMYLGGFEAIKDKPLPFICLSCRMPIYKIENLYSHVHDIHGVIVTERKDDN